MVENEGGYKKKSDFGIEVLSGETLKAKCRRTADIRGIFGAESAALGKPCVFVLLRDQISQSGPVGLVVLCGFLSLPRSGWGLELLRLGEARSQL